MKLEEAQAVYVRPGEATGKLVNRRIKTYLKKVLREKAEVLTGKSWQELDLDYRAEFIIEGSPGRGTAALHMTAGGGCYGMGKQRPQDIKIGFFQRELFEA